jgi:hypothetical protein
VSPWQALRAVVGAGHWPWAVGHAVQRDTMSREYGPQLESGQVVGLLVGGRLRVRIPGQAADVVWTPGEIAEYGLKRVTLPELSDGGTALAGLLLLARTLEGTVQARWRGSTLRTWSITHPATGCRVALGQDADDLACALHHHLARAAASGRSSPWDPRPGGDAANRRSE